jgi:hypothetical protein
MTKMDHQHRLRDSNWQIPRVLVNLCFWQDLIRKPPRGTYSSKEIMEFCCRNCVGRFQETLHRGRARPTNMWGRSAAHGGHRAYAPPMSASHCYVSSLLPSRMHLSRSFKSAWSKGKDWCSGLYIPACTPRLEAKSDLESWEARNPNSICSLGSRASNQYKISPL